MTRLSTSLYQRYEASLTPGSISVRGGAISFGMPISKNIEVLHTGSSYFITTAEAKRLTASNQASWDGPKRLKLAPDKSKRDIWEPKQSGYAGPLVLQLT